MSIEHQLEAMNGMIAEGRILDAVDTFFHENIVTKDAAQEPVSGKRAKRQMLESFVNSIAKVNEISIHHNAVNSKTSYSEYTFSFDLQDGTEIRWHEVISRKWQDGKVIEEVYYQN